MKWIIYSFIVFFLLWGCTSNSVNRQDLEQQLSQFQVQNFSSPDSWDQREEWFACLMKGGYFQEAESLLAAMVENEENLSFESSIEAAKLHYLRGDYQRAEEILQEAKQDSDVKWNQITVDLYLCFIYYQTNRYDRADGLFSGTTQLSRGQERILGDNLSLWRFMSSFDTQPYEMDWQGRGSTVLPFIPAEEWRLPSVEFSVNGVDTAGLLDTGGDMLILPAELAEQAGIRVITGGTGFYAAGEEVEFGYGVAHKIVFGDVILSNVPIEIGHSNEVIIGTALLKQFLPTIDYLGQQLILYPKTNGGREQFRNERLNDQTQSYPFYLYATHLILAHGSINDSGQLLFLMDSGLEDPQGASMTLPGETIEMLGCSLPETEVKTGESGAGTVEMEIGYLQLDSVSLGPLVQQNPRVIYGPFPPQLYHDSLEMIVDGILSHHFLRDYAWTLDFDNQVMYFSN